MFWNPFFIRPRYPFCLVVVRRTTQNSQLGQSTVEYVLLLAVVVSLVFTVINSARFKDLLGEGGGFALRMKDEMEWNYRFASQYYGEASAFNVNLGSRNHPGYYNQRRGATHFIGPLRPYPR